MTDDLQRRPKATRTKPSEPDTVDLGQWYWVKDVDDGDELMCVQIVGSNFVKLKNVGNWTIRVHADSFPNRCTLESNPQPYLDSQVEKHRGRAQGLLDQIQKVTAELGITPRGQLGASAPTAQGQALVTASSMQDPQVHKLALIKAKEETLPALFKEMKEEHESMAMWMRANLLPLTAETDNLKKRSGKIEDHIFAVELYAGLVEQLVQIQDGDPAPNDTKVVLHQRMHYMDEECLADYNAGGMEFKTSNEFDKWLLKPGNLNRILPHQRCMVAFRVRRNVKHRGDISPWIRIQLEDADKKTFLYIRNGDRVYWLATEIEFSAQLFPDEEYAKVLGQGESLYAEMWSNHRIDRLLTRKEHDDIMSRHKKGVAEYKEKKKAWDAMSEKEREGHCSWGPTKPRLSNEYIPCTPASVYYDDMMEMVADQIKQHNRTIVIMQGLLDRSEALHPHPPWQLWTLEGFNQGLTLLYDESRALPSHIKPPDFHEYQRQINKNLKRGDITIGQQLAWEKQEAVKENDRQANDYRIQHSSNYRCYRPYGNPGPGEAAVIVRFSKKHQTCTYAWVRKSANYYWLPVSDRPGYVRQQRKDIKARGTVSIKSLFRVESYTPGDYHIFFDDPRTRADYLKWAPYLLMAEDYHAGKIKVGPEEPEEY